MKEFYEILGLNENASIEEIKEAFKKLSMKIHPDKGGSEYLFKVVNGAYQELINYHKDGKLNNVEQKFLFGNKEDDNKIVDLICEEIFKTFKLLNYNSFTIGIKIKYLIIIAKKYNSSSLVVNNKLHSIKISNIFKFNTSYDICKYICELHGIDTTKKGFEDNIKQLFIKISAKDIINENGGMILNDDSNSYQNNNEETIDIKDYDKNKRNRDLNKCPNNNKLHSLFAKNDNKLDKKNISHLSNSDMIIIFVCIVIVIKLVGLLFS